MESRIVTKGIFYGVGVGPGDPQLMTLKAVRTIERCPVVAAPRTKAGMVALDIARGAMDLDGKIVLPLDFAMSHDAAVRRASHLAAAALVRGHLDGGADVAMLNLGDVSIYASFHYIRDILAGGGYEMVMIPGVTSFCAAAAELGVSLTDIGTPLHVIPDGHDESGAAMDQPGTRIWMKSGRRLPLLLDQLRKRGLAGEAMLVQNCGLPDQRVYRGLDDAEVASDYFSVTIVKDRLGTK